MPNNLDICYFAEQPKVDSRKVSGYAIVFNVLSPDRGGFKQRFAPESVNRTLNSGADVWALHSHDMKSPVARRGNGSLRLKADNHGLFTEFDVAATRAGDDMLELIRSGVIVGMSFGIANAKGRKSVIGGMPVYTYSDMDLIEVSPTAAPVFSQTSVEAHARFAAFTDEETDADALDHYYRRLKVRA
jgi:HK97 family phage prohead protease